jgi:hypothetical protein
VLKISKAIQGFHTNITDLEARQTPRTPLEEREKRGNMEKTTIQNIKSIEAECAKLYGESMKVWNQLIEYEDLQEIGKNLQDV